VSTHGNDGGPGTIDAPWRTLRYAVTRLQAGDTVLMRGGTYDDFLENPALAGTSWEQPIRIAAYGDETVWLAPRSGNYVIWFSGSQRYVEFDRINIDARKTALGAPVKIESWQGGNPHHIRLKNSELVSGSDGVPNQGTNGGGTGVLVTASVSGVTGGNQFQNLKVRGGGDPGDFSFGFYLQSDDNLVEQCDISDTSGAGVQIYNGYGFPPSGNIVRSNRIHNITRSADKRSWGVIDAGKDSQIRDNTIFNVGVRGWAGAGIEIYYGWRPVIDSNTVYSNHPVGIQINHEVYDAVVTNNRSYDNDENFVDQGIGTTVSNNAFSGGPR
jgi:hypothetical protein